MGNSNSANAVRHLDRGPKRRAGDILNVLRYPAIHERYQPAPRVGNTDRMVVCRCWLSLKFPYCDNTHQDLWKQGINVGPCMVQFVPKSTAIKNVGADVVEHSDSDEKSVVQNLSSGSTGFVSEEKGRHFLKLVLGTTACGVGLGAYEDEVKDARTSVKHAIRTTIL